MSNKTKLVQRQAHCHCTAVPAFTGLFSADDGDRRRQVSPCLRSGRLLVDLETLACSDCEPHQASVSVGGGRQAGKRAGWPRRRRARRSGRDTERQEAAGSPPRQLLGNWCSALQVGLSQLPAADIASSRNRQEEEEEEEEEERVWR